MQTTTLLRSGLEPLAIALILAPEPSTTVIGLALLGYIRTQRYLQSKQKENVRHYARYKPRYTLKMKLVRGEIVYRSYPALSGQLPPASPAEKGMFYNPVLWSDYVRRTARKIEGGKTVNRVISAAPAVCAFKRPANMHAVSSYRLPSFYRPQPAIAAARV